MKNRNRCDGGTATEIREKLQSLADPGRARVLQGFFKTGTGEYGEGDRFLGIRVPILRGLAKEHRELGEKGVIRLLKSAYHEERLLALLIMVDQYRGGGEGRRRQIYALYLGSTGFINNWDLVDVTCEHIVGAHLRERSRRPLYRLARSSSLWERRIAIVSTFHFIRRDDFHSTLEIADLLLHDDEDLIHKAVGWMLREVGKRDFAVEESFLGERYRLMPRTMLRYAIEKFPEPLRQRYLKGRV